MWARVLICVWMVDVVMCVRQNSEQHENDTHPNMDNATLTGENNTLEGTVKEDLSQHIQGRSQNVSTGMARNRSLDCFRPVDCADYLVLGSNQSGVYKIYPFTCRCTEGVQVYCDMETDGGGWTVFLKRQEDKLLNFNRSWSEYKDGFGNPSGEYWLGTEYLHTITSNRDYALRLDLQAGTWQQSIWANFKVDDEVERYRMTWKTYNTEISTTSRNCLAHSNGRFFSTYDRDQDSVLDNCALQHGGGWWYYNCQHFNPTTSLNASGGFNISCYNKDFQTVQNLQLKIRPAMCSANVKAVYLNRYKCEGCHYAVQPLTIKGD